MTKVKCPNCKGTGKYHSCVYCGGGDCAYCQWTDGDTIPKKYEGLEISDLEEKGICCLCTGTGKLHKDQFDEIQADLLEMKNDA